MPAITNKRIYYGVQQVMIEGDGGDWTFDTSGKEVRGLQSASMSTNFNLVQVFELGQQAIYENIEELPDVELSMTKVLDGAPLMYHLATVDATSPSLGGRSNAKCKFALGIWTDTNESATGSAPSVVVCSGMYVGSVGYSIPLDDNMTEDVTLVGNHKVWLNADTFFTDLSSSLPDPTMDGQFTTNNDSPDASTGVNRRQDLRFTYTAVTTDTNGMVADADCTILPPEVFGISTSGTNEKTDGQNFDAHITSISVSVDFGRDNLNELGRRGPYHRVLQYPTEVTCEVEVTSSSGDMVSATEEGVRTTGTGICADFGNLTNRTIRIATCEGTRIYLGAKNKLASVNYSGGDAGGANVAVTYSFSTYNDFTVMHSADPHASGATWWAARTGYLLDM